MFHKLEMKQNVQNRTQRLFKQELWASRIASPFLNPISFQSHGEKINLSYPLAENIHTTSSVFSVCFWHVDIFHIYLKNKLKTKRKEIGKQPQK